jgi:hypothetical protein
MSKKEGHNSEKKFNVGNCMSYQSSFSIDCYLFLTLEEIEDKF